MNGKTPNEDQLSSLLQLRSQKIQEIKAAADEVARLSALIDGHPNTVSRTPAIKPGRPMRAVLDFMKLQTGPVSLRELVRGIRKTGWGANEADPGRMLRNAARYLVMTGHLVRNEDRSVSLSTPSDVGDYARYRKSTVAIKSFLHTAKTPQTQKAIINALLAGGFAPHDADRRRTVRAGVAMGRRTESS